MQVNDGTTTPVQIELSQILHALEHDNEFFIQFMLGEELTTPVPDFHLDVFSRMISEDVTRFACAIPRDHAKTTLAKLACVRYFLFTDYRFIVYLSNTHAIAVESCNDVINFICGENTVKVFGETEFLVRQDGKGLYKFDIGTKRCILRAFGANQQVRGINVDNQRPQLAIIDDLEDNDNIATEELFKKLKKWFYGPFIKALDKRGNKAIQLGNMISDRMLLKLHCESDTWHSMRYGSIKKDGTPLWPEMFSIEKLRKEFKEYSEVGESDTWFAEMMNMPIMAGNGLIRADRIFYAQTVNVDDVEYGFITVDPAISDKSWAHKTVVAVHGWIPHLGCWMIIDYSYGTGVDPIQLYDMIYDMALKWQVGVVGIESVAYQASLKYVFSYISMQRATDWMSFVDLDANARKTERLAAWAGMISDHAYAIPYGDFTIVEQLLQYNPTRRENDDDVIDACAYGPQMIARYIGLIQEELSPFGPENNTRSLSMYEISQI